MANEIEKLDAMVGNVMSVFKPIIIDTLSGTEDFDKQCSEVMQVLHDIVDQSTDELVSETEKEIKKKL